MSIEGKSKTIESSEPDEVTSFAKEDSDKIKDVNNLRSEYLNSLRIATLTVDIHRHT